MITESSMDATTWNSIITELPDPHVLQTWQWALVKSRYNWEPLPTIWHDRQGQLAAAAMVLARRIPIRGRFVRLAVMYVPKGPLLRDWSDEKLRSQVCRDLQALARRNGAIFVKIDPDVPLGTGIPGKPETRESVAGKAVVQHLQNFGWRLSTEQVQFSNTIFVDLSLDEDELLARMKQKTRYNIRLAIRKGVTVRVGNPDDMGLLYRMYAETAIRDGFVIREQDYYQTVWDTFIQAGMAEPLIAEVAGEPVAAMVVFRFGGKAWYMYGMSRELHREKMVNYLLQWEAMRRAKAAGCRVYDMWGAPDEFSEKDHLWGVYRFKEGFGGEIVRHIGAWDLPVRWLYYHTYTQFLPRLLDWMRSRGKARTEEYIRKLPYG